MYWIALEFGKHKGRTLPEIVLKDPDWFFWAMENNKFYGTALLKQAKLIDERARLIKIPDNQDEQLVIEYTMHPGDYSCCGFTIEDKSSPQHTGGSGTARSKSLSLCFPRSLKSYDKLGCNLLIKDFKRLILGNGAKRITKQFAEDFFEDMGNFDKAGK